MTITSKSRPKAEAETARPTETAESTIQDRIDAMIAEGIKNAPPPLSVEEQRKKNQMAREMLRAWREEDATDDPEQIAQSETEWEEFKKSMNESHSSNRVLFP